MSGIKYVRLTLKEAFQLIKNTKYIFCVMVGLFVLSVLFLNLLVILIMHTSSYAVWLNDPIVNDILSMPGTILSGIFLAATSILSVQRAQGTPISIKLGLQEAWQINSRVMMLVFAFTVSLLVLDVMQFFLQSYFSSKMARVLIAVGMMLVGEISNLVFLSFALPLLWFKNASASQALTCSAKAFYKNFPQIFMINLVAGLGLILGLLTLGIGLIWAVPFSCMVNGIIVRDLILPAMQSKIL